jgi:transcription initiation factor IIE alpha subunit
MKENENNYKLDFLKNLSYKVQCPRCKKTIYTRDENKIYEKLSEHLEICKVKLKLK